MSKQDDLKRAAAEAAFDYVREGEYLGVGTGSTANHFIDLLGALRHDFKGAVASSQATAEQTQSIRAARSGSMCLAISGEGASMTKRTAPPSMLKARTCGVCPKVSGPLAFSFFIMG